MNRVSKHQNKLMMMLQPRMQRLMDKIKREYNESYFDMDEETKDIICFQLAASVILSTLELLNYRYAPEEIPAIMELAHLNLQIMEQEFLQWEMYAYAQIMVDSRRQLTNEVFEMVGNKL